MTSARATSPQASTPFHDIAGRKLLVANRSEIAIRIMRAANELGLRTVAIYAQEDRFCIHRFKADESYLVGADKGPVGAYLDIDGIIALALDIRKGSPTFGKIIAYDLPADTTLIDRIVANEPIASP